MNEKTRRILGIFGILFLTFILGVASTFLIVYEFPYLFDIVVTKVYKEVTVTDTGIAASVEKVYDSVVVVTTYNQGNTLSNGSGFIYKVDGSDTYLITNYHVVEGGDSYKVTYTDSDVLDATLVGGDEYSDIAVLKVKTKDDYLAVQIGSSENMKVGDTTFTIGVPLDNTYSWTVTRGILSGKERLVKVSLSSLASSDYIIKVLQTDAAVNSGNSGGPISNSNGEVIGVINAKISSTGVEGIGFAIPIEEAVEKAEELINGENSEYPYLGISMLDVDVARSYPTYKKYLSDSSVTSGVIVIDVEDGSPAFEAGIESGDIITKINGENTSNVAYLRYELYKCDINDTIEVTVIRNGEEKKLEVGLSLKL